MIEALLSLLSYIIPFLVVLTVIVFVHEMGHYLVARWNGVAIQTFSLGFGRELAGFTDKSGTRWRLSAIPLGGYVRFVGDMNPASAPDRDMLAEMDPAIRNSLFYYKNVWQRIAVVVAGPAANFIFTFVVFYALLMSLGQYTIPPVIQDVVPDSPAAVAGLEPGDRVVGVDGYEVRGFEDFQRLVATSPGRPVTVYVERDGERLGFLVTPEIVEQEDALGNINKIGRLGVSRQTTAEDIEHIRPDPIDAVGITVSRMWLIVDRTFAFIGDFFVGRGDPDQLGGPIKVAQVSGDVATLGWLELVNWIALLSLSIGLFNLFPIPLLDGGHLLFYLIEAVRGKPLSPRVQEAGFRFGLAIVFTLMVFTIAIDIPDVVNRLM
ncbi:RIP metalloprotease RseP [Cucumibacter marinus]|uniref:RIP metalloprotease RseP n=1 Tax=Cucumibacter marinus TaxID=1121252 RepID=UPI00040343F9|nr:RIP metalloprotease RseP [Cucumibacter marinus]